jgi:hypothetical protein
MCVSLREILQVRIREKSTRQKALVFIASDGLPLGFRKWEPETMDIWWTLSALNGVYRRRERDF